MYACFSQVFYFQENVILTFNAISVRNFLRSLCIVEAFTMQYVAQKEVNLVMVSEMMGGKGIFKGGFP